LQHGSSTLVATWPQHRRGLCKGGLQACQRLQGQDAAASPDQVWQSQAAFCRKGISASKGHQCVQRPSVRHSPALPTPILPPLTVKTTGNPSQRTLAHSPPNQSSNCFCCALRSCSSYRSSCFQRPPRPSATLLLPLLHPLPCIACHTPPVSDWAVDQLLKRAPFLGDAISCFAPAHAGQARTGGQRCSASCTEMLESKLSQCFNAEVNIELPLQWGIQCRVNSQDLQRSVCLYSHRLSYTPKACINTYIHTHSHKPWSHASMHGRLGFRTHSACTNTHARTNTHTRTRTRAGTWARAGARHDAGGKAAPDGCGAGVRGYAAHAHALRMPLRGCACPWRDRHRADAACKRGGKRGAGKMRQASCMFLSVRALICEAFLNRSYACDAIARLCAMRCKTIEVHTYLHARFASPDLA